MMSGALEFGLIEDLATKQAAGGEEGDSDALAFRESLDGLESEALLETMKTLFADQMSEIMGIEPEDIEPDMSLTLLGMDSLMAMELGSKMKAALGIELPMSVYLEGPTINKLVNFVGDYILKERGEVLEAATVES